MKKFYESPIVEITIFDVEDVVATTTSSVDTSVLSGVEETEAINKMIQALSEGSTANANKVGRARRFGGYNW